MRRLLAVVVPALTACRVLDEQHCANLAGDATCRGQSAGLEYCNRCVAAHDGCVAAPPDPECADEPTTAGTTDVADATTTVVGTSGPMDSTTNGVDPSSSSDASTIAGSTSEDSSTDTTATVASDDETTDAAICGDGVITGAEECDGADLGGLDCAGLPEFADGELACDPTCVLDTSGCTACHGSASMCRADAECCSESCSGLGLCL